MHLAIKKCGIGDKNGEFRSRYAERTCVDSYDCLRYSLTGMMRVIHGAHCRTTSRHGRAVFASWWMILWDFPVMHEMTLLPKRSASGCLPCGHPREIIPSRQTTRIDHLYGSILPSLHSVDLKALYWIDYWSWAGASKLCFHAIAGGIAYRSVSKL